MIAGIIDDGKVVVSTGECVCKYKELSELTCPIDTHGSLQILKVPTATTMVMDRHICDRKVWYEYNMAFYQWKDSLYPLLRGALYHKALLSGVPMKEMQFFAASNGSIWGGRIDAYDPCTATLYESKTTRTLPSAPRPWDRMQMDLYTTLLRKNGYKVDHCKAMYFTFEEYGTHEITPNVISDDVIYDLVKETKKHMDVVEGTYRQGWACSYCSFWRYCSIGINKLRDDYARNTEFNKTAPPSRQRNTMPMVPPSLAVRWSNEKVYTSDELIKGPMIPPDVQAHLLPDGYTEVTPVPQPGLVTPPPQSFEELQRSRQAYEAEQQRKYQEFQERLHRGFGL